MIPVNTDADMMSVLKRLGKEKRMPVYIYRCLECKKSRKELVRALSEMEDPVWCEKCGGQMEQTPAPVAKFVRGSGGWSSPA